MTVDGTSSVRLEDTGELCASVADCAVLMRGFLVAGGDDAGDVRTVEALEPALLWLVAEAPLHRRLDLARVEVGAGDALVAPPARVCGSCLRSDFFAGVSVTFFGDSSPSSIEASVRASA